MELFDVKNRSVGMIVYSLPEDGIRREFAPGETKRISFDELEKLSYQPGGRELMRDFLQLKNVKIRENLDLHTEAEYDMSEEQIAQMILTGSQAQFLDCLDFAPAGVIDLIKVLAIKLPMTDANKREALKEKTGFDVDAALANVRAEKETDVKPAETIANAETGHKRRTETPSYTETEEEKKITIIKQLIIHIFLNSQQTVY